MIIDYLSVMECQARLSDCLNYTPTLRWTSFQDLHHCFLTEVLSRTRSPIVFPTGHQYENLRVFQTEVYKHPSRKLGTPGCRPSSLSFTSYQLSFDYFFLTRIMLAFKLLTPFALLAGVLAHPLWSRADAPPSDTDILSSCPGGPGT